MPSLRWGADTDVGRSRSLNEDAILTAAPVFGVADGMGGHAAGEIASQIAVETLAALAEHDEITGDSMVEAVQLANRAIYDRAQSDPTTRGMGTTLVGLALVGPGGGATSRNRLAIVNVGDSRVYRIENGVLHQVSNDHSYVAELVAAGEITAAQARSHPNRNIVTRALGIEPTIEVDLWEMPAVVGHRFLLCSDGLVDEVADATIGDVLMAEADPQVAADRLVHLANEHGGHDNISVVVVDVIDGEFHQPPTTTTIQAEIPDGGDDPDATQVIASAGGRPRSRRNPLAIAKTTTFVLTLVGVFAVAIGGVRYYGHQGTFVGFHGDQVAVYEGRPGGVLWVSPRLLSTYPLRRSQLSADWQQLIAGDITFTSKAAADSWFAALRTNPTANLSLPPPPTTTTTTTVPPTTTTIAATTTAPPPTTTTTAGP